MSLQGIERFIQYIQADENTWNNYLTPIPNMCCIICKSVSDNDYIMKIGNGVDRFSDLPIFMKFSRVKRAYYLNALQIDVAHDVNKIYYMDENLKIKTSDITIDDINNALSQISNIEFRNNITIPYINGSSEGKINEDIILKVELVDIFGRVHVPIEKAIWTLPDNTTIEGISLVYHIPNDNTLLGTTLSFKVEVEDKYGNQSRTGSKSVKVVSSRVSGYIDVENSSIKIKSVLTNKPNIKNISWNDVEHHSNNTYTLIITAEDPNNQTLSYKVICSDNNVLVNQDPTHPNIFNVTYPSYNFITDVYYIIEVTNEDGYSTSKGDKKVVIPDNSEY